MLYVFLIGYFGIRQGGIFTNPAFLPSQKIILDASAAQELIAPDAKLENQINGEPVRVKYQKTKLSGR